MEYLDDELSEEQRSSFESHLEVCAACVAFIESYKQTLQLTKQLRISEAGEELGEKVEDKVLGDVPHGLVDAILAARPK
jgi:anti-sigma factor RsiW